MTHSQWKRWEKLRITGKINFIFLIGGLICGLVMAFAATLINQLINPNDYWGFSLLIYFIIFSFIGIMVAIFIWNKNETKFMSENPPEHRHISHTHHHAKQYHR
jgi:uncharacterized membrane protein YeaQ/YmgE (transglycosylase-associated protein family)